MDTFNRIDFGKGRRLTRFPSGFRFDATIKNKSGKVKIQKMSSAKIEQVVDMAAITFTSFDCDQSAETDKVTIWAKKNELKHIIEELFRVWEMVE